MLIEFKVANYRSIKDEVTLSFVAERAPRHADNLIDCDGYKLLKAMAMFGANASGKSNIVKAIGAMRNFVTQSATRMNIGDSIRAAEPFLLDPETTDAATRFEITIALPQGIFRYGFSVNTIRVLEEFLFRRASQSTKETTLLRRKYSGSPGAYEFLYEGTDKDKFALIFDTLRDNALMISVGSQFNLHEYIPVYAFFTSLLEIRDMSSPSFALQREAIMRSEGDEIFRHSLSELIKDADTSIESYRIDKIIEERNFDESDPATSLDEGIIDGAKSRMHRTTRRNAVTVHRNSVGNFIEFNMEQQESHGTQRLFGLGGLFISALEQGQVVVLDEFDASLHPRLTRALVQLFQSATANKKGAQLLFTTHDTALFSSDLFRRDQLILVEKYSTGTELYSLADLEKPPRNDSVFMPHYLAGQFGGSPHLGRTFEMNEIGEGSE